MTMLKKTHLLAFILLACTSLRAQERISSTINSSWQFIKGDTTKASDQNKWSTVAIPHTWNAKDVFDEEPGYYRGVGWYKKRFTSLQIGKKRKFTFNLMALVKWPRFT